MGEECGTFGREERYVQGFGGERIDFGVSTAYRKD
jgi:hypothetical protein